MSQPKTIESADDDESLAALGIEVGDRIGRYVVLSQAGVGAMGMVLAAYDPELDRKAALELWATNQALAIAHAGDPFGLREALRLNSLAAVHWGAGEHEDAARLYEQVVEMRAAALARVLPDDRRADARELVEQALAVYELDADSAGYVRNAQTWLSEHP